MQKPTASAGKTASPGDNYNLNVEVNADGSVKVIPPATNTAPATNAAPAPAPPK